MRRQQTEQVLYRIESIFQNIGFRRHIPGVESLRSQQIYLELCNIIFHDHAIELIKIKESGLSPGEKLDQLVALVGRIIGMELPHISGRLISEGNLNHASNLLELLQYVSGSAAEPTDDYEVHSAPQVDNDDLDQSTPLNHTVQATRQQFGYSQSDQNSVRTEDEEHKQNNSESNSDESPLPPAPSGDGQNKTNTQPSFRQSNKKKQMKAGKKEYPPPLPAKPLTKQQRLIQMNQKIKIAYASKLLSTVEHLQRKRLEDFKITCNKQQNRVINKARIQLKEQRDENNKLSMVLRENQVYARATRSAISKGQNQLPINMYKILKSHKKLNNQHRLRNLQNKHKQLMAIVQDTADIEEMQAMLLDTFKW